MTEIIKSLTQICAQLKKEQQNLVEVAPVFSIGFFLLSVISTSFAAFFYDVAINTFKINVFTRLIIVLCTVSVWCCSMTFLAWLFEINF